MEAKQVHLLRDFVQLLQAKPDTLNLPELSFFREWLISLGATIPQSHEDKPSSTEDSGAEDFSESDIEFDDVDVVPGESVSDLDIDDTDVTDEMMEQCVSKKSDAQSKFSEGDFAAALSLYTEAIKLNPSALLLARRASCYIKLSKPSHAIRDCDKAISINSDSATSYKWRGIAHKMLGHWEEAYSDLQTALKLDFSDDVFETVKEIEPMHKRILEHNLRYKRMRDEKAYNEKRERARKIQEERERARKEEEANSAKNGMDGQAGMGAAFSQLFNDPELISAVQDPEVMRAFSEVCSNPSAMDKYKDNPKIKRVIEKMQNKFGGSGCMPGGMPFGAGSGFKMPNQTCPDLD